MRCVSPLSIRNPRVKANPTYYRQIDGLDGFVGLGGEIEPARIEVPCGKCIICQENRRSEWATRMELESRTAKTTSFLTLTYSPEFRPDELKVEHLQKFFKRLRKRISCRYFACGEYGDLHQAPHYHAIVWHDLSHEDFQLECNKSWKFGFLMVKEASREAFRYVAKYVCKSVKSLPFDGAAEPFAVMSRRPGVSFPYFDTLKSYYHEYILLESGYKAKLPDYLLNKLDPVEGISIKRHRQELAESLPELSDTEKLLRSQALEESLTRKHLRKYGR